MGLGTRLTNTHLTVVEVAEAYIRLPRSTREAGFADVSDQNVVNEDFLT